MDENWYEFREKFGILLILDEPRAVVKYIEVLNKCCCTYRQSIHLTD